MTKVICGFPGTGKSYFARTATGLVSDSDSSSFSWIQQDGEKVRNPNFPTNYIDHIKYLIDQQYTYVFVSTHKDVINALSNSGIEFSIIYPSRELKQEYLDRYRNRKSPEVFINLLDSKWDEFIDDVESASVATLIPLKAGQYIQDVLKSLN